MPLKGKHALITGSSRGIGRGIALKLAEKGARVAVHYYQNEAAAKDTLARVKKAGSDGFVVQADVSRIEDIRRMFKRVEEEFGKLDIFVSNARTELPTFYSKPLDISLENWDMAMDSQAKAFLVAGRESVRLMRDSGRIIAITYAPGGRTGSWQPWIAMGSAKAALESLCRYFAVALGKRGITVNAICPGYVDTEMTSRGIENIVAKTGKSADDALAVLKRSSPQNRLVTAEEVAALALLLASEEGRGINGQAINVDGGTVLF